MGSSEMDKGLNFSDEDGVGKRKSEMGIENKESKKSEMGIGKRNKKAKRRRFSIFPKFSCMRLDDEVPVVETPADEGGFDVEASQKGPGPAPNHLVVMVNGIIGSVDDWKYAAEQFVKAYPHDIIVYRSQSNYSKLTFDGVDVMGIRLAEEVQSVVKRTPHIQKISFVGHSLGGLVCRYAIAKLYEQRSARITCGQGMECSLNGSTDACAKEVSKKIAGLEPVNFITFATPHLGCRGHKQAPAFCGLYSLEKVAASSSWLLGRSGRHLFLKDHDEGKPPLLLRMASDSEDLPFISALQSFKRRVAYANTSFDYLVGWSTSSLRRRSDLPKRRNMKKVDKYPHIVNIEEATSVSFQEETPTMANINGHKSQQMEEAMIRGLTKLSWERVDVSFKGSIQKFLAHTAIQVQSYNINSDGVDVIQHMIDNFAF
ncbi:putative lipase YDL109C [Solanum pennellii]|uniref:Lipase YDL109C n=1 Tax=Solanum pennellii TaxID=28526 RepID=A0ABM1GNK8_SOLPN|nr:putative lipase YDL109C [Solanum pennellii]